MSGPAGGAARGVRSLLRAGRTRAPERLPTVPDPGSGLDAAAPRPLASRPRALRSAGPAGPGSLRCSRLRIRETTKEPPTLMQAHEGLLASSSLGPSIPITVEQGLGPRGGFQLSFMGWSKGPPKRVEEFLKFCLHFDMEPSRALSSVLILIGASCPRLGLCSYSNMGLSRTLGRKLSCSCN